MAQAASRLDVRLKRVYLPPSPEDRRSRPGGPPLAAQRTPTRRRRRPMAKGGGARPRSSAAGSVMLQAQGAGSTIRSTVRSSGSLRGPRGSRRRFVLDVSVAAISAFVSSSACVSPRSSIASSSYSTRSLPRLGQQQLQTLNFQGAELSLALRISQHLMYRTSSREPARNWWASVARPDRIELGTAAQGPST